MLDIHRANAGRGFVDYVRGTLETCICGILARKSDQTQKPTVD